MGDESFGFDIGRCLVKLINADNDAAFAQTDVVNNHFRFGRGGSIQQ